MQGLFEKSVHMKMEDAGFVMLGARPTEKRFQREKMEHCLWFENNNNDPIPYLSEVKYVVLREQWRGGPNDDETVKQQGKLDAYITKLMAYTRGNLYNTYSFDWVKDYQDFQSTLSLQDSKSEEDAYEINDYLKDIFDKIPETTIKRVISPLDDKFQAWLDTLTQEWTRRFQLMLSENNLGILLPEIGQPSAYQSMPLLSMHMMHCALIAFCSHHPNVTLCGPGLRGELIEAGSKVALPEWKERTDGDAKMRSLCFRILLLHAVLPDKADDFAEICLRRAFGLTNTSLPLKFTNNALQLNNVNVPDATKGAAANFGENVANLFDDDQQKKFEKKFDEIQRMDHFQPGCGEPGLTEAERQELKRDLEYAHLVKGAMVNTDLHVLWAPEDESMLARVDDEAFLKVMWEFIQGMISTTLRGNGENHAQDSEAIARRIIYVKEVMRRAWVNSQRYRLSNELIMAEDDILARLKEEKPLSTAMANVQAKTLRANAAIKKRWASAVGKRMLTQRLSTRGRVSIIEHQRSAAWAEGEYKALRCAILKSRP